METLPSIQASGPRPAAGVATPGLRQAATEFEAVFLAEMLRHAGLGAVRDGPGGGGAGEQGFSGMLVREYAGEIARQGGTGLADQVYRAMRERLAP